MEKVNYEKFKPYAQKLFIFPSVLSDKRGNAGILYYM